MTKEEAIMVLAMDLDNSGRRDRQMTARLLRAVAPVVLRYFDEEIKRFHAPGLSHRELAECIRDLISVHIAANSILHFVEFGQLIAANTAEGGIDAYTRGYGELNAKAFELAARVNRQIARQEINRFVQEHA